MGAYLDLWKREISRSNKRQPEVIDQNQTQVTMCRLVNDFQSRTINVCVYLSVKDGSATRNHFAREGAA